MKPDDISITVAPKNGKAPRRVTARFGKLEFRDNLDTNSSTARERFIKKMAAKFAAEPEAVAFIDNKLIELADAADLEAAQIVEEETTPRRARAKVETMPGRPKIDTSCKDLPVISAKAWESLAAANDPPSLFRYGGVASRIESGDEEEPIIKALTFDRMRYALARSAEWTEWKRSGEDLVERATVPPMDVVNDVLATPDIKLPILTRIVEAPVFAMDGTLQTTPGYHPRSQTYYVPAAGFTVPNVPETPDSQDVESARNILCDELLGDFPFVVSDSAKPSAELAHAVALLLLPFARDLISGPTPLHLIEKPSPGTGATLLVDMLAFPAIGRSMAIMTEGRDEDEWRKRITAKLRSAPAHLNIDNLRRRLDSAAVSAAITSTTWEDRILGVSEMGRIPVRCAWVATGNNPGTSTEVARRTVRIRMDAKQDRPWLRTEFRHPNLRQWATDNRGLLAWAALTLIRSWIVRGRAKGQTTLGMFEQWAEVLGGILDNAGIVGFLSNLEEFYEESDAEGTTWRAFMAAWWEMEVDREVLVKDLYPVATEAGLQLGDGKEQSQKVTLGRMLAEKRDRVYDLEANGRKRQLVVRRGGQAKRATLWQLQTIE